MPRTKQQRLVEYRRWELIEPLLPPRPVPKCPGGRPWVPMSGPHSKGSCSCCTSGCRWRDIPPQRGYGSGHTAWRRLRAWRAAGGWDRLLRLVLNQLSEAELIDWSRGCVDSVSVRAKGGDLTGGTRPTAVRPGTKYHLLVDARGLILHSLLSPANTLRSGLKIVDVAVGRCPRELS